MKIKYPQDNPAEHLAEYKALIIAFMKSNQDLSDITNDEYFKELEGDGTPADEMVMFAVSQYENWNIVVFDDVAKTSCMLGKTRNEVCRRLTIPSRFLKRESQPEEARNFPTG
jgi:hypothetical protein